MRDTAQEPGAGSAQVERGVLAERGCRLPVLLGVVVIGVGPVPRLRVRETAVFAKVKANRLLPGE